MINSRIVADDDDIPFASDAVCNREPIVTLLSEGHCFALHSRATNGIDNIGKYIQIWFRKNEFFKFQQRRNTKSKLSFNRYEPAKRKIKTNGKHRKLLLKSTFIGTGNHEVKLTFKYMYRQCNMSSITYFYYFVITVQYKHYAKQFSYLKMSISQSGKMMQIKPVCVC